jgi:hypothetical protein
MSDAFDNQSAGNETGNPEIDGMVLIPFGKQPNAISKLESEPKSDPSLRVRWK